MILVHSYASLWLPWIPVHLHVSSIVYLDEQRVDAWVYLDYENALESLLIEGCIRLHLDGSITFSIVVHTGAWQEDHLYSRFTYYTRVHIIKGFVFCPGRVYAHIRTNQVLCRDLLIQPHADYCTIVWYGTSRQLNGSKNVEVIQNAGLRFVLRVPQTVTGPELRQKRTRHTILC